MRWIAARPTSPARPMADPAVHRIAVPVPAQKSESGREFMRETIKIVVAERFFMSPIDRETEIEKLIDQINRAPVIQPAFVRAVIPFDFFDAFDLFHFR